MYKYIFYKIITCFFISVEAFIVRYLSGGSSLYIQDSLPIYSIIFFQNFFSLFFVFFLLKNQLVNLFFTSNFFLNLLRVLFNIFGILLWYLSLKYLPVIEVISISFFIPIINIVGAVIFLKENLTLYKFFMILTALIGFFVSMRPDYLYDKIDNISLIFLLPFFASVCMACSKLIMRKLMILNHSPWQLIIYFFPCIFLVCLIFFCIYDFCFPLYYHWIWLFILSLINILINYFFAKSYIKGEIIFLLPFGIATKLFFGGIISFYLFSEVKHFYPIFLGLFIFLFNFLLVIYNYFFCFKLK